MGTSRGLSFRRAAGSASARLISSLVSWPLVVGSRPVMPPATSPSAIAWTSSGCRPGKAEIWSNVRGLFSTSQTAVALGINTCDMGSSPEPGYRARPCPRQPEKRPKVAGQCMAETGPKPGNGPKRKRPGSARPSLKTCASDRLLDDDLDAAVLRLAHTVCGLDQEALLTAADHRDRLRRPALTHQGILDRVRT